MNLDIFKKPDPSGKMSREKYVMNNHKEEYDYIINYCLENNIESSFKEKVYLCLNNIKSVPICENPTCEKIVKYKNSNIGYLKYCSNKCISSDPKIKKKKEEKSLEKYGTKTPAQSKEVKDKIIKTNNKRYGGNSPMCSEKQKELAKETLYKNYGVYNPSKSSYILEKRIKSFKKSTYKESYKKTSLIKYGVDHPWKNKEIHNKTIDRFYDYYRDRINGKLNKYKNYKFIDFEKEDGKYSNLILFCNKCHSEFKINNYQFYYRANSGISICTNCYPISDSSSISQKDIVSFVKDNYNGTVIENERNVIKPYEVDVYLPELNLGIEFNGVYWHSVKFKDKDYHKLKQDSANDNNLNLITIWEDEWILKRELCESFILNKIGKNKRKIYARKCKVKSIDYNTSREFLNDNHLQGDCKSSIRLGLYLNEELVSIMTFSKLRITLNSRDKDGHLELTRFCNKINTTVVGGASKLFTFLKRNYDFDVIETYSDNLISNGDLYDKLGFDNIHESKPGFWYLIDGIRKHRFNYRKHKLVEMGYDKEKTGEDIMIDLGYYRIYNAGNKKWIYTN